MNLSGKRSAPTSAHQPSENDGQKPPQQLDQKSGQSPDRRLFWVLAVALLTLLINLNGWSVLEASEARYAEISREMFRASNWLHPALLNIWHYHKPPVTFWLTSLGFQLFGVNAFGGRFFLQLSLVAQGALVYGIAERLFSQPVSQLVNQPGAKNSSDRIRPLLATLIYLSLPLSILGARNLTTDSFLTTLVLATVYCMSAYYCQRQVWGIYGSAITIGIGFLTKGPAVFVVPFFFWLYLMLARKENYRVPIHHLLVACLLCISLSLSWYVYVSGEVSGLADYFIGKQIIARVTDDQAFDRAKPLWYYPLVLVTTTLPWGFLYAATWLRPGKKRFQGKPQNIEAQQLPLYWILMPLVVFELSSSKLMLYLLPMYPGIAIILACALVNLSSSTLKGLTKLFFVFYELLGAVALFGVIIAQQLGADIVVTLPMVAIALFLLLLPPIVCLRLHSPPLRISVMAFLCMMTVTLYGSYFLQANELLVGGTRPLAQFIKAQGLQDQPVLVYNKLLPSLAFNLDRNTITLNDEDAEQTISRETQFQTDDDWRKYWVYSRRPEAKAYLQSLADAPSTLVARGEVPSRWNWLINSYPQSKKIGRWTIFYRQN